MSQLVHSRNGDAASARVVEQAVVVLCAIASTKMQPGIRQFAEELGISKTTLQRILTSLENSGIVAIDPKDQTYFITSKALVLANGFHRTHDVITMLRPAMESLRAMSGETVTLAVESDGYRVTIFQLESKHDLRYTNQLGGRYPLIVGAAGRVLLASLGDVRRREVLSQYTKEKITRPDGELIKVDPEEIERQVRETQANGYALSRGEWEHSSLGLSVPIITPTGDAAALSVYGLADRLGEERVTNLIEAMTRISQDTSWVRTQEASLQH
ncbi:MAG: IclR family transcriptional regulator [Actinomycetota bacterium]|nr:IclR family transcriptional regulator [Actinomycetota bacterium]